jgi:hypothetical protein
MLSDAVSAKKAEGTAKESVEVLDVAQILARSMVRAEPAYRALTAPVEVAPETAELAAAGEPAGSAGGSPSAPEVG